MLLDQLAQAIAADPPVWYFDAPADSSAITALEQSIGLALPSSYRRFLSRFDGGFASIAGRPNQPHWNMKTARWNSNWLFGVQEIARHHKRLLDMLGWGDTPPRGWCFIPFCQTKAQELLVFGESDPDTAESPVLDACHEDSPWRMLYPSFAHLLQAYINGRGQIEIIAPV